MAGLSSRAICITGSGDLIRRKATKGDNIPFRIVLLVEIIPMRILRD